MLAIVLLIWLICAIVGALISHSKGYSAVSGFLAGLFLGPIGIAILAILKTKFERDAIAAAKPPTHKQARQAARNEAATPTYEENRDRMSRH